MTKALVVKQKERIFEYPALGLVKKQKPCFIGTGKGFGRNYQEAPGVARPASDQSVPFRPQRENALGAGVLPGSGKRYPGRSMPGE